MPVRNCCLGCQGPMCGPCGGPCSYRQECTGVGPSCPMAVFNKCCAPCAAGEIGIIHGARCGMAGSYYSCGAGCIGGCTGGVCRSCCGPSC